MIGLHLDLIHEHFILSEVSSKNLVCKFRINKIASDVFWAENNPIMGAIDALRKQFGSGFNSEP
jgi:hypothetical protein